MGTRMWRTLITVAGLAVVAVTTGTAVFAAIEDQDDRPAARQTLDAPASACLEGATECDDNPGADVASICLEGAEDCDDTIGDETSAPMCAPGHPDCEDMIVDGGFEQCATDEPCGEFDQRCAANTDCVEPGFLPEEPVCPEGLSYEECFPDGTPQGWDCVQLESFPVQIKCHYLGCVPIDGPVTILPAPVEDLPLETDVEPAIEPVDPGLIDPGIAVGEPVPTEPYECLPPVDCDVEPIPYGCLGHPCAISSRYDERCVPEECEVLEDGSFVCKIPPPVECGPNELCLSPDCAVSSDGTTYCPDAAPLPCVQVEADPDGCASPGSCGFLGCDGIACPDDITAEECEKILEEQRRNSAGGGTSSSGGDIDPSE